MGHVPRESLGSVSQVCAPVESHLYRGAALEVHKVGRYRCEKASQKTGQHIPEEVLHWGTLLPEDCPKANLIDLPAEVQRYRHGLI